MSSHGLGNCVFLIYPTDHMLFRKYVLISRAGDVREVSEIREITTNQFRRECEIDISQAVVSAPFRVDPKARMTLGGVFRTCRMSLPLCLFDNAVHSLVSVGFDKLLPK
jgi:hypothetical protein